MLSKLFNLRKGFWDREKEFLLMLAIFLAAVFVFHDQPAIAMWIGFIFAGYSAIANDSIQTLGTFLSSNRKVPWWLLWIFIGGILSAVLIYGWLTGDGNVSFGRLDKIPEVSEFHILQLVAPLALLVLTRFKVPVSTTFLLLSVFSSGKTILAMLEKTFMGYFVAFIAALVIWSMVAKLQKKQWLFKPSYNKKLWRVFQWGATAYLWATWLMHDIANTAVFLPRTLSFNQFVAFLLFLVIGMGILLSMRGGRIQQIITEKTDVIDVRAATIIDLVFATILLIFKEWSSIPMSTTWVFLGLLAGREVALAYLSKVRGNYKETLVLVMKDLGLAGIGLLVSLAMAWSASGFQLFS